MKIHPLNSFRYLDVSNFRSGFLAWLKEARKQIEEGKQPGGPPSMDPVVAAMHNYGLYQSSCILTSLDLVNPTNRASASELSRYVPYNAYNSEAYGYEAHCKYIPGGSASPLGALASATLCEVLQDGNQDWENYTDDTAVGYLLRRRGYSCRIRTKLPLLAGTIDYYADKAPRDDQPAGTPTKDYTEFRYGEIIRSLPQLNTKILTSDEPFDYFVEGYDTSQCYWSDDVIDGRILAEMTRFNLCIPEYPNGMKPGIPAGYDADSDPSVSTLTVFSGIDGFSTPHEVVKLTAGIPLVSEVAHAINSLRSYNKGESDFSDPDPRKEKGITRSNLSRTPLRASWMDALIQSFDEVILKGGKLFTQRVGFTIQELPLLTQEAKSDAEKLITLEPETEIPTGTPYEFTDPEISIDPPNALLEWPRNITNVTALSGGKLYAYPFALMVEWLTILRTSAAVPIYPSSFIDLGAPDDGSGLPESVVSTNRKRVVSTYTSSTQARWERDSTKFEGGKMLIKFIRVQGEPVKGESNDNFASHIAQSYVGSHPTIATEIYDFDEGDIPDGEDPDSFIPPSEFYLETVYDKYQVFTEREEKLEKGGPRVYRGMYSGSGYISFTQVFDNGTSAVASVSGVSGTFHPWLKPELKIRVAYRDCITTTYRNDIRTERKYRYRFKELTLKPVKLKDVTIMSGFKGDAVCLEAVDDGWISMMNTNSFDLLKDADYISTCEVSTDYIGPIDSIFELSPVE